MVRVFLNVGYYIFTDVSPTHPKQYTQATSTMWGVIVSTGTRGRYLYSPRDGSLAMLLLRAGRASSQVSEGQRSLIGPLYSAPTTRGTSCLACLVRRPKLRRESGCKYM